MVLLNDLYRVTDDCTTEGGRDFSISLNAGHIIYKAHFPGEPVTPGVCILQMGVELAALAAGLPLELRTARNVKFLKPVEPDKTPALTCSLRNLSVCDDTASVEVTFRAQETVFAKLSLVCSLKSEK